jgi:hypothetical protein
MLRYMLRPPLERQPLVFEALHHVDQLERIVTHHDHFPGNEIKRGVVSENGVGDRITPSITSILKKKYINCR